MNRAVFGAMVLILLGFCAPCAGDDVEIADLSPQLRLDLRAARHTATHGERVALIGLLRNRSSEPVVVRPVRMFGYINYSFEPRAGGESFGPAGQVIGESFPGSDPGPLVLLRPGRAVTGRSVFTLLDPDRALGPGTYVVSIDYCEFIGGTLEDRPALEGCVSSNSVTIDVEP